MPPTTRRSILATSTEVDRAPDPDGIYNAASGEVFVLNGKWSFSVSKDTALNADGTMLPGTYTVDVAFRSGDAFEVATTATLKILP
jgi:hypothetical protein